MPSATKTAIIPLLLASVFLTPATATRADERETYRQILNQQKSQQELYIKRLDLLPGKKKIEDLLRVASDQGKLTLKSPLFGAAEQMKNRQMRAEVEGFEGFCTLMVQPINNGQYYFTFSNMAYPNMEGVTNFSISMQPGYLQISKNHSSQSKNYTINLMQTQNRSMFGQPDGIQLNVYGADNAGRVAVSINLSEPDFTTLRRKHPREVDQYLRPLLRELKLENLFAVDEGMAWQVFSEEWKGDQEIAAKLKALLPGLEGDAYSDRETARQAIRKLGSEAALVIYRMDRSGLTPEQNCQLDSVLSTYSFMSRPEAQRLTSDVDFLLDCLYSDNPEVRGIAARHLKQTVHRDVAVDPKTDYDTRVAHVEALRGELGRGGATTQPVGKG
ncbi:MAG: hypothetical protein JWN40_3963 [Phycisphaerales bacterium]|nr:hypothetical protein [Phycisphaerales bacterium]